MQNEIKKLTNKEFLAIRMRLASRLGVKIPQGVFGHSIGYRGPTVCTFESDAKIGIPLSQLMRFIDKADDKTVREILGL